jgi:hypothetical protein
LAATRYTYGGRGYLRFAELTAAVPCPAGECEVRIDRGGPSRVHITILAPGAIPEAEVALLAEQVRGQVIAFCQTPIRDFGQDAIERIADDGSRKRSICARTLNNRVDLDVRVPFAHQSDLSPKTVEELRYVIATHAAVPTRFLTSIEHSLRQETSDVEAFLAMYAVLKSVLGGKQSDLDSYILAAEPNCETVKDSRGRVVTIYTKLRNAKGHPTGMPPAEASEHISRLLPKLRQHAVTALFRPTAQ